MHTIYPRGAYAMYNTHNTKLCNYYNNNTECRKVTDQPYASKRLERFSPSIFKNRHTLSNFPAWPYSLIIIIIRYKPCPRNNECRWRESATS